MISEVILWTKAVWARNPVRDNVPPTRTGVPEGAARRIAGAPKAAVMPASPTRTWRRRHECLLTILVSSVQAHYFCAVARSWFNASGL